MRESQKKSEFKCTDCKKSFTEENETTNCISPSYYLCNKCLKKKEIEYKRTKYIEKLKTLPKKFRYLKDKYNLKKKINELKNQSLFLFGETGSGKTALATFILKSLWKDGKPGKFISYPEFVFKIITDFNSAHEKVDFIKTYKRCLVIDDFGAEKVTDFIRHVSYLIIDYRESNELKTIITSNFSLDEIDAFIDRRISSRICGMCKVIKMSGDKRLKSISKTNTLVCLPAKGIKNANT